MGGRSNGEYKKGLWSEEEDKILIDYIKLHGKGKWTRVAKETGLKRCGKSCRLRWMNYLSPNVKRGDFSEEENDLIIRLHKLLGNRWSLIAGRVPGRTDNQVKNHWNTRLRKKLEVNKRSRKTNHSSFNFSNDKEDNVMNNANSKSCTILHPVCNDESTGENVKEVGSSENVVFSHTDDPTSSDCYGSILLMNNDLNSYIPNITEFLNDPFDVLWQCL